MSAGVEFVNGIRVDACVVHQDSTFCERQPLQDAVHSTPQRIVLCRAVLCCALSPAPMSAGVELSNGSGVDARVVLVNADPFRLLMPCCAVIWQCAQV
jgi:hypothetical protein